MDILLTFAGNQDPFNPEVVKGVFTDGPVLTLLAERAFAAIHIFTTPNTLPNAQQLQQEIAARTGNCRTRIHNINIPVPALRERREDIPFLVEYFLDRHNGRYRQKKQFNREALRRILEYPWPGNVRELENAVERAFVLSGGNVIKETDLPPEILSAPTYVAVDISEAEVYHSSREVHHNRRG